MTETETNYENLRWRMTDTKTYYERRPVRLIEQRLIMDNTVAAKLNASLTINSGIGARQNTDYGHCHWRLVQMGPVQCAHGPMCPRTQPDKPTDRFVHRPIIIGLDYG